MRSNYYKEETDKIILKRWNASICTPTTIVGMEEVSIFAFQYISIFICIWFLLWFLFPFFHLCSRCLSPSPFCYFAWTFQNRPQYWNSSMARCSFIWKDVFDSENTQRLPYFLCIWAKLEVGSKMGNLLTSGSEADQQTDDSLWGSGGERSNAFPQPLCYIVS